MKKFKNILAYIYFFPLSLIIAIIASGTISVLQNLFNSISCKFLLVPNWFLSNYTNCSGVYNQRTFLADVAFFYIFITSIEFFIPNHKKIAKIIATIFSSILMGIMLFLLIWHRIFNEHTLNTTVIFLGLIVWLIVQLKEYLKQ